MVATVSISRNQTLTIDGDRFDSETQQSIRRNFQEFNKVCDLVTFAGESRKVLFQGKFDGEEIIILYSSSVGSGGESPRFVLYLDEGFEKEMKCL